MPRVAVTVTCASSNPKVPRHKMTGFAPSITSPLAVTRVIRWENGKWTEQENWCITHRPTGLRLGNAEWDTSVAAYRALLDCDPDFAGWRNAKGLISGVLDPTTLICRERFKKVVGADFR